MDIEALLDDAAVLLDLTETSLERIIHTILTKTLDILDAPLAYEEAMTKKNNSSGASDTSSPHHM